MNKRRLFLIFLGAASGSAATAAGLAAAPANLLGWVMVFVGVGYCFGGSLYLAFEPRQAMRAETGDRSLWALAPGALAVLFLPVLDHLFFPVIIPRAAAWQAAGLILISLGMAVRIWVRVVLGRLYSGKLQIKTDHILVTGGPFRFVRHPSYDGFLLEGMGLAVGFSSLSGILAVLFLLVPGFIYRIKVEETLLSEQFGDAYQRYTRQTKRLVPGIY